MRSEPPWAVVRPEPNPEAERGADCFSPQYTHCNVPPKEFTTNLMDGDRKYKSRGYQDSGSSQSNGQASQKPRPPQGPRPPIDVTGPRLPRLVQAVTASRCYNCATTLPMGTDMKAHCPKCNAALHCCKQCAQFESSTRFQCLKPVPVRIAIKDQANECELFSQRVTVARDAKSPMGQSGFGGFGSRPLGNGNGSNGYSNGGNGDPRMNETRNASDARAAFDSLFKK